VVEDGFFIVCFLVVFSMEIFLQLLISVGTLPVPARDVFNSAQAPMLPQDQSTTQFQQSQRYCGCNLVVGKIMTTRSIESLFIDQSVSCDLFTRSGNGKGVLEFWNGDRCRPLSREVIYP